MAKEHNRGQIWTDKPHNFLWFSINFTRYILTEEKLITRKGFFNVKEDEIMLYRVVDKKLELPLGQRMFGCGTIHLHSKDKDTPEKVLKKIKNPRTIMSLLDDAILASRKRHQVYGRDVLTGVSPDYTDADGNGIPDYLED